MQMKKLLDPVFTLVWLFLAIQLLLEELLELLLEVFILTVSSRRAVSR